MRLVGTVTDTTRRQSTERLQPLTALDGSERDTRAASDPAVVAAALDGDGDARSRLVRDHLRMAMAVAVEYMSTREDAEDVVQDAFRSAFANLDRFDRRRPFAPWLLTIVRNTARNALASRRVRSHETLSPVHAARDATPFENAHRRELRQAIDEAISRLPPAQQTCFRLCIVEGLTSAEAANATGVAESTVRVHIFRARRALQGLLERWRDEVE